MSIVRDDLACIKMRMRPPIFAKWVDSGDKQNMNHIVAISGSTKKENSDSTVDCGI
jgi:hypothetical protein